MPLPPAKSHKSAAAKVVPFHQPDQRVRMLPVRRSLPVWLRLLIQLQRGSTIVAFVLVAATLVVYSTTIYTQQLWSRDYQRLKAMQRQERQMIATSETLKHQLAQQAQKPESGLVRRLPQQAIYLPPAPEPVAKPVVPSPSPAESAPPKPLGY